MSRHVKRLCVMIIALAVLGVIGMVSYGALMYRMPGPSTRNVTVLVQKGMPLKAIAAEFEERGLIDRPLVFMILAKVTENRRYLKAGEYAFPPDISIRDILAKMRGGDVVIRKVTLPEGITTYQALELIRQADGLVGEVPGDIAEGALLPETYHFTYGDTRAEVVQRIQKRMKETIDALWPTRQPDLPFTTIEQALTLASIVEKETGVPEERKRVAAVFINRLRKGIPLQSDPTVIYAIAGGGYDLGRLLTRKDLQYASPFNTYYAVGLPPHPIANPGKASIEAVLQPMETDEYYFVATGDGGHRFARTLQEHNNNVIQYRKKLRELKAP